MTWVAVRRVEFACCLHIAGNPVIIIPPDEFHALLTAALKEGPGDPGMALEALQRALVAVEAEARLQFRAR